MKKVGQHDAENAREQTNVILPRLDLANALRNIPSVAAPDADDLALWINLMRRQTV